MEIEQEGSTAGKSVKWKKRKEILWGCSQKSTEAPSMAEPCSLRKSQGTHSQHLTGQNKSHETMEDFPNTSTASRKEVSELCPRDRSSKAEKKCVYEDLTQIQVPGRHVIQKHSQGRKDGKSLISDLLTSGPPISYNPQKLRRSFFHTSTMEQIPGLKSGLKALLCSAGNWVCSDRGVLSCTG